MKPVNLLSSNALREYAIVVTVNLSVLVTGMSLTWPSPMLVKLSDPSQSPFPRPITTEEGSWIVAGGLLLAIISFIPIGYLIDCIGRKFSLILTVVPKLCGYFILLFGKQIWTVILARVIILAADCMVLIVVPVYASELASTKHRYALSTYVQIFSASGILITYSVGPFVSYNAFNIILTAMITASAIPQLFMPESPYHMYSKGKIADATKILFFLRMSDTEVKKELEEYSNNDKNKIKINKIALFRNKIFLKSLGIGFLLVCGINVVGFNAVQFYMQTIMESTVTSVRSEIASVIIGIIQLAASLCTAPVSNRFGRRMVLITSLTGILIGLIGLGTFFQVTENPEYVVHGFMNYLPTMSLVVFVFCYSTGIGSLVWAILAEIFEGPARAFGVSITLTIGNLIGFFLIKFFASLTLALGAANTYWLFSVNTTIAIALIFLFMPETKGKSFDEIQIALKSQFFYFKNEKVEKKNFSTA